MADENPNQDEQVRKQQEEARRRSEQAAEARKQADQQKTRRTNVLLKSGNGTVNIEDYDPKIHGAKVEETDEEYRRRVYGAPALAVVHPLTTIPNLATFDTAAQMPAPAPAIAVPAAPPASLRVAPESPEQAKARQEAVVLAEQTASEEAHRRGLAVHEEAQRQATAARAAAPQGSAVAASPIAGAVAVPGGGVPAVGGAGRTSGEFASAADKANRTDGQAGGEKAAGEKGQGGQEGQG